MTSARRSPFAAALLAAGCAAWIGCDSQTVVADPNGPAPVVVAPPPVVPPPAAAPPAAAPVRPAQPRGDAVAAASTEPDDETDAPLRSTAPRRGSTRPQAERRGDPEPDPADDATGDAAASPDVLPSDMLAGTEDEPAPAGTLILPPADGPAYELGPVEVQSAGFGRTALAVGFRRVGGGEIGPDEAGAELEVFIGGRPWGGSAVPLRGAEGQVTVQLGEETGTPTLYAVRDAPVPGLRYLLSDAVTPAGPGDTPPARALTRSEQAVAARNTPPTDLPDGHLRLGPDAPVWPGVPVMVHTGEGWAAGVVEEVDRADPASPRISIRLTADAGSLKEGAAVSAPRDDWLAKQTGADDWVAVDPDTRLAAADRPDWFDPATGSGPNGSGSVIGTPRDPGGPPPRAADYPITLEIPREAQALPEELTLPTGTTVAYEDRGGWKEAELIGPDEGDTLRVHRTDLPAVFPDELIARDQLIVLKKDVRRLELDQKRAERLGEPIPHVREPAAEGEPQE